MSSEVTCVAVCTRVRRAAFAVIGPDGIYTVHRTAFHRGSETAVIQQAEALGMAYGAHALVVEPGVFQPDAIATTSLPVVAFTLTHAKAALCTTERPTHRDLVQAVLETHPAASRLIQGAKLSGPTAHLHRWRTVLVFAIGLGLGYLKTKASASRTDRLTVGRS